MDDETKAYIEALTQWFATEVARVSGPHTESGHNGPPPPPPPPTKPIKTGSN